MMEKGGGWKGERGGGGKVVGKARREKRIEGRDRGEVGKEGRVGG